MNTIGYFEIQSSHPNKEINFYQAVLAGNLQKMSFFQLNTTELKPIVFMEVC